MYRLLNLIVCTLLSAVLFASPAYAFTPTIDGNPSDWILAPPAIGNLGHVGRNSSSEGQYIWTDCPNDERTDTVSPASSDPEVDLLEFRAAADTSNLYFLAKFSDLPASGNTTQLQIAIDTTFDANGQTYFAGYSDTQVSTNSSTGYQSQWGQARWEYLVQTRFAMGSAPIVFNTGFESMGTGTSIISGSNDTIEIRIPLAHLGLDGSASPVKLRLSVAVFRGVSGSGCGDQECILDVNDGQGFDPSNALDAITNYAVPGTCDKLDTGVYNTWDDVQDGYLDYHFDMYIDADQGSTIFEVYSPILLKEIYYHETAQSEGESVKIHSNWPEALALDYWKIGDEEEPRSGEGVLRFPDGSQIPGNQSQIVVENAAIFVLFSSVSGPPWPAHYEYNNTDASVPEMLTYPIWADGTFDLDNSGEEVLLLDPFDTVMDVVTYGSGSWAGVQATSDSPAELQTLKRKDETVDTNNVSTDFKALSPTMIGSTGCIDAQGVDTCISNNCENLISVENGKVCCRETNCDVGAGNTCCYAGCDSDGFCTTAGNDSLCISCSDPNVKSVGTCTGCGTSGASGTCSASATYTCTAQSHTLCQEATCDGTRYFCTEIGGVWEWRIDGSCDDGDACTATSICNQGACQGTAMGECVDDDGCCPMGCNADVDNDCSVGCGNGMVEGDETCDPPESCATSCVDADPCTDDYMTGAAETCNVVCHNDLVTECRIGDGCCPFGCNNNNDDTCPVICGNGEVEDGETCDPPGSCPTECNDNNACTSDTLTGSAEGCNVDCEFTAITYCSGGDGCCPDACDQSTDSDCGAECGNNIIEAGESCDPPATCPTLADCNDFDACTADSTIGEAASCNVMCQHTDITSCSNDDGCCPDGCNLSNDNDCVAVCGDGVVEGNETCDPPESCPADCNDSDACTTDSYSGMPSTCNVVCEHADITSCINGDGCCPDTCNATSDSDCGRVCGNEIVEPGETCDPPASCPVACDDGVDCTADFLQGSAESCTARCEYIAIEICQNDDNCCPETCSEVDDNDCDPVCGNDVVETGETCDPYYTCPNCDDTNPCTNDITTGTPETCDVVCSHEDITECVSGDNCCPSNCNSENDDECISTCGNGVIEEGESCDPPSTCPEDCEDLDPCTSDYATGSAENCTAGCIHSPINTCINSDGCCPQVCDFTIDNDCVNNCGNGQIDSGESCDPPASCPTSCNDNDPCTEDNLLGSAEFCTAHCSFDMISDCADNDDCCPTGCTLAIDNDCPYIGGDSCEEAILTPLNLPSDFNTLGLTNNFTGGPPCTDEALDGPDVYFLVRVLPGQYQVRITPLGDGDPVLVLIDDCTLESCFTVIDHGGPGEPELMEGIQVLGARANNEILFVVDSVSPDGVGAFSLVAEEDLGPDGDADEDIDIPEDGDEDDIDDDPEVEPYPCMYHEDCPIGYSCLESDGICLIDPYATACADDSECVEGYVCFRTADRPNEGKCIPDDSPPDGDVSDGDVTDGDVQDGDITDGDATDGDVSDGDVSDGDATDGDVQDGDTTDGDATDGDTSDGDMSDGDATDGDSGEGDDADGDGTTDDGGSSCNHSGIGGSWLALLVLVLLFRRRENELPG